MLIRFGSGEFVVHTKTWGVFWYQMLTYSPKVYTAFSYMQLGEAPAPSL